MPRSGAGRLESASSAPIGHPGPLASPTTPAPFRRDPGTTRTQRHARAPVSISGTRWYGRRPRAAGARWPAVGNDVRRCQRRVSRATGDASPKALVTQAVHGCQYQQNGSQRQHSRHCLPPYRGGIYHVLDDRHEAMRMSECRPSESDRLVLRQSDARCRSACARQLASRPAKNAGPRFSTAPIASRAADREIVPKLPLKPGDVVADYRPDPVLFEVQLGKAVSPGGTVYAVDIDEGFFADIQSGRRRRG